MTAHSALLAAGVVVAGAREGEIESWVTPGSPGSFRGASRAEMQASGRTYVSHEDTVAQWDHAGDHHAACYVSA